MKTLVVHDSTYGNTEALATAIGEALGDATVSAIGDIVASDLRELDLLIVGSPTQGGRPTAALTHLLDSIPARGLDGTAVAVFDTRFATNDHGFGLRLLMKVIGFAAPRIVRTLLAKGGRLAALPEGFIVEAKEGPLKPGELERAADWARTLVEGLDSWRRATTLTNSLSRSRDDARTCAGDRYRSAPESPVSGRPTHG